ncbi:sigma-70 family RNA polymerase sigma factor [Candidatus Poribacteria bacterium]|nr:sigma-70 family RNA polymerase sigma factor [Candidatus Poribacteria bacterium]
MSDEKDFVIFMRQNQESVYRLAFHLLGNEEDAKDATQEVFMRVWERFDEMRRQTGRAWVLKITVNLCLDWLRRRKFIADFTEREESSTDIEHRLLDHRPDPLEQCLNREIQAKVREAILKLPPVYRAVVILRDLEGMSYKEIAETLNLTISAVKSNLFRGRRKLRELLRPFFEVNG